MAAFSWSDSLHAALAPCLSCFRSQNGPSEPAQNAFLANERSAELEGLLADSQPSTEDDAISMVSHPGDRRRKKKKGKKVIRLFGFDLFGRPPVHLSEDEEGRRRTTSSASGDSDAAPLDPSTIDARALVAQQAAERERREKEERRRKRREKKKSLAVALDRENRDEFEGFQGSGTLSPTHMVSPSDRSQSSHSSSSRPSQDFGPFHTAHPNPPHHSPHHKDTDHIDGGDADFGADTYVPTTRTPTLAGGSSASRSSRSHSISHLSPSLGSASNAGEGEVVYNHHYISQAQHDHQRSTLEHGQPTDRPKRKKRSSRSRHSLSSTSQPTESSIASPPAQHTSFPAIAEHDHPSGFDEHGYHHEQRGYVPVGVHLPYQKDAREGLPSVGFERSGGGGFPSTGFSRSRSGSKAELGGGNGAFLARRGDD